MGDFLKQMADSSHERVRSLLRRIGREELHRLASDAPAPRTLALSDEGFDLIAEFKPASPAVGVLLAGGMNAEGLIGSAISAYAAGGAAAVSVLTEPHRFRGSLELLDSAVDASPIPVMRKDFLIDPIQVAEARARGASGVLLIARLLDDAMLAEMCRTATELNLFVLFEAFDDNDLERIAEVIHALPEPRLVGLNCRDLSTLAVDFNRLLHLADAFPPGVVRVAESGVETPEDVRRLRDAGYHAALVGSALMRAPDPGEAVAAMLAAGRSR